MAQSILYYPSINIEDGSWLRSAILYWDEINSIVPHKEYYDLSPELLYLQELGQYRPIYPEEIFVLCDPHEFSVLVKRCLFHNIHHTKQRQLLTKQIYSPGLVSLVHYKKLPSEILELLTKHNGIHIDTNGWIEMSGEFAMQYMRLLAEFTAVHSINDTIVGTNQISKINEVYPQGFSSSNSAAVTILLEKCLPIPTMDVSLEDLISFKEKYREEFLQLRCKIRELEKSIAESESITQLKATTAAFRETWEHELISKGKMFKGRRIRFALGSLRAFVSDAGAVAGLAQLVQANSILNIHKTTIGMTVGMAGLIGIGAYVIRYKDQLNAAQKGNSFAYVLSAKKEGLLRHTDKVEII